MERTRNGRTPRLLAVIALVSAWVLASAPIAAAGNATGINVTLPVGGKYTGRVVDAKTGLGIAGVGIWVNPTDYRGAGTDAEITTDANGAYAISGLFTGVTHEVTFRADDGIHVSGCWSGNATHFDVACGSTPAPKPVAAGTSLGITKLPRGATLSGIVKGGTAASSTPLAGVEVRVRGNDYYFATTKADGSWKAGGLPPGDYRIQYDAPPTLNFRDGYYRVNTSGTNWSATAYTFVTVGTANKSANVVLPTGRTVTGYIKTSAGAPVQGAEVEVGDPELGPGYHYGSVITDAAGKYVVKGMNPGTYYVGVRRPAGRNLMDGFYRKGAIGNFTPDQATWTTITIGSVNVTLPDIKAWTGYTITGKVLMPNGSPAVGAWAGENDWASHWDETDATGAFRIIGIPPGTYRPWIGSPNATARGGWFDAGTPVNRLTTDKTKADAKTLTAATPTWNIGTVKLFAAGTGYSISGVVKGGSTALAGARVSGGDWSTFSFASATTATDGTYKLTRLLAGAYVVEVRPPTGRNYVAGWYRAGVAGNWTRDESLATKVVVGP